MWLKSQLTSIRRVEKEDLKMVDLERKIKIERCDDDGVVDEGRTFENNYNFFPRDELDKKLKGAEQREESLIKRITEKDKTISKMTYDDERVHVPSKQ